MRRPVLGVFLILWASYAFFWHARDWNTASRLMLTYSLVDRGTIRIDGLETRPATALATRAIPTPTSSPATRSWRPSPTPSSGG